jgi:truncated hemoglobin YjbI
MSINLYTEIGPERLRLLVTQFYNEVFSNEILAPFFPKVKELSLKPNNFNS